MPNLTEMNDEQTVIIPAAEIYRQLQEHLPPDERLHLLAQQMEADRYKFDRRVESTRRDITNLGLGPAQA